MVAAVALSACGSDSGSSTSTTAGGQKEVRIGMLKAGQTGYEAGYEVGAEKAAKAGGAKLVNFSANFDPNKQLQQCQDAIAAGKVDQLIIVPVDGAAILPCVAAAKAAGIGVFSLDTPIGPDYASTELQAPGITGQVIQPITDDAQAAVNMVVKACGDKDPCNVALGVGEPAFTYSANKLKYEKEYLAKHPNIKVVGTMQTGLSEPDKAQSATQDLLSKNPDVDVILTDDDIGMTGVARSVKAAGKDGQVALIADAASRTGAKAVAAGDWYGTVIYLPATVAQVGVEMAIDNARGKKIANNNVRVKDLNELGTLELTKENVDQFTPEWDAATQ